jgi:hypothetical protein
MIIFIYCLHKPNLTNLTKNLMLSVGNCWFFYCTWKCRARPSASRSPASTEAKTVKVAGPLVADAAGLLPLGLVMTLETAVAVTAADAKLVDAGALELEAALLVAEETLTAAAEAVLGDETTAETDPLATALVSTVVAVVILPATETPVALALEEDETSKLSATCCCAFLFTNSQNAALPSLLTVS